MALDFDAQNVFEDEKPWYRSPLPWVAVGLLAAVIAGFSLHAVREAAQERETDAFLAALAQATTPDARLKVAQANATLPAAAGELTLLGGNFAVGKNLPDAQAAFALVTRNFPSNPVAVPARLGLAQVLAAQGKKDEAIALLQQPIPAEADGYRPLGLLLLGDLRRQQKDFKGARQALQDLVAKYPQSAFVPEANELLAGLPAS